MKKSLLSLLMVLVLTVCLLSACTGTTPDMAEKEAKAAITLETLDWSFQVEGAEETEYTIADAKTHEIRKMITTCTLSGTGDVKAALKSFRVDGISLQEFLADVGATNVTGITYYGHDIYGDEMTYTFTAEEVASDEIMIAWISNLENVMPDSITYVGIFAPTSSSTFVGCTSLTRIVIS
ncbi:MAG: hypothetical protein IKM13_01420 [Clostridia bacterium]|nr:hypothetical protein [Clostridia bacterium]